MKKYICTEEQLIAFAHASRDAKIGDSISKVAVSVGFQEVSEDNSEQGESP